MSLVEAAQAFPDSDVVENSLLDAIRDRRVLYLYLNTNEKKETYAVGDSILHMGGAESEAFLSCFYNLHRMNRVSSSGADSEAVLAKHLSKNK